MVCKLGLSVADSLQFHMITHRLAGRCKAPLAARCTQNRITTEALTVTLKATMYRDAHQKCYPLDWANFGLRRIVMDNGTEDKFLLRQCIIITYSRRMFLCGSIPRADRHIYMANVGPASGTRNTRPRPNLDLHMQVLHTLNRFDIALSRLA